MSLLIRRLRKSGKVRSKKASTRVDMTPLADLGFLLITFFMFATTFSKPNVMGLNMPPKIEDKDQDQVKPPEIDLTNSISIVIGGDGTLFWHQKEKNKVSADELNETDYSRDGIRKEIIAARQRATKPENFTVIIKPTDESNYENLVNVLDEMQITESSRYGIVDLDPNEVQAYEEKRGISSNQN